MKTMLDLIKPMNDKARAELTPQNIKETKNGLLLKVEYNLAELRRQLKGLNNEILIEKFDGIIDKYIFLKKLIEWSISGKNDNSFQI
jgi:hypothetical protein